MLFELSHPSLPDTREMESLHLAIRSIAPGHLPELEFPQKNQEACRIGSTEGRWVSVDGAFPEWRSGGGFHFG